MSALIGEIKRGDGTAVGYVHASLGGVELHNDPEYTLTPIEARNAATLLVRGADEVERMRLRRAGSEPLSVDELTTKQRVLDAQDREIGQQIVNDAHIRTIEDAKQLAANWIATAAQESRNAEYMAAERDKLRAQLDDLKSRI
jgi:hypothetical protein